MGEQDTRRVYIPMSTCRIIGRKRISEIYSRSQGPGSIQSASKTRTLQRPKDGDKGRDILRAGQ